MRFGQYLRATLAETGAMLRRHFGAEMKALGLLAVGVVLFSIIRAQFGTSDGEDVALAMGQNLQAAFVTLVLIIPPALLLDVLFGAPYRLHGRLSQSLAERTADSDALLQRIRDMEEVAPQIEPEIVGPESFGTTGQNRVVQLHFFNRGMRSRTATGVTAEISFSREGSEDEPRGMRADWISLTTNPNDIGPLNQNVSEIDIPHSHIPRKLNVAIRLENQDFAQVWSSWKYVNTTHARIQQGRYLVCVHLMAPGVDQKHWYTLINEGNDFRIVERPDLTQDAR